MHRIHGEILLARSKRNTDEAEGRFLHSISVARQQSAHSWELRGATSLARLLQSQGRFEEAEDLLKPICEWFTEGLETGDHIKARRTLEEMSPRT